MDCVGRTVSVLAWAVFACSGPERPSEPGATPAPTEPAPAKAEPTAAPNPQYVGRETCGTCHADVSARYAGSHHDLAMQPATAQTVLGNFEGQTFRYFGSVSRFERDGDAFVVRTLGDDGKVHPYRVKYTFGVTPLQQYLVETAPGRLQALPLAWDTRPKPKGGQRWFHLHPDEKIGPGDPLFWTSDVNNWNRGCADCHSTGLARGYDRKSQRYDTTYAEIDVSCEACHGPASVHVARARAGDLHGDLGLSSALPKASERRWEFRPGQRIAQLANDTRSEELERCAQCHSRRGELGLAGGGFHDHYRLALLDDDLYFADGQMLDEVYVYGSFLQSKMARAGVRCSDCHEPHSLRLRTEGNALCGRCHEPAAFDTPAHHFHPKGGPGAQCVDCHMPSRVYMGVDARREHHFSVPRPDRSLSLGVPEPCTGCHRKDTPQWAAGVLREHGYGKRGTDFPEALAAARREEIGSFAPLRAVIEDPKQPAIVRATAVSALRTVAAPAILPLLRAAVRDDSPLVRRAAAEAASALPATESARLLAPLLTDPVRSVRLESVGRLVAGSATIPPELNARVRDALAEYRADREANADSPSALLDLANLAMRAGEHTTAIALYEEAITRDPTFTVAYANLADVYRSTGDEARAVLTFERGLERAADTATLRHALALARVRTGNKPEARTLLAQAHAQRPLDLGLGYTFAVAVSETDLGRAIRVLTQLREHHPGNLQVLQALATYQQRAGNLEAAAESRAAIERRLAELR